MVAIRSYVRRYPHAGPAAPKTVRVCAHVRSLPGMRRRLK